jgi:transposase
MDNARIHHAKILKPIFCKLNIFYSPAYSPFLNPIEEYFAILKSRMRHLIFNSRY